MSSNTVNDIPKIVERLRSVCSRKGLRLVDVTRKHVKTAKWCEVIEKLMDTCPIVIRWGKGYDTNVLLTDSGPIPDGVQPLIKISYREKGHLIHEVTSLPEKNLHIYFEGLFHDKKETTCVACMNDVRHVIPCTTCGNDTYCDDCMIKAVDQHRSQTKCPLCRCPNFFSQSFIGSIGGHPTMYKKYRDSHQDMKDPFANILMQVHNPLYDKYH